LIHDAIIVRGAWPKEKGPISPVLSVSIRSLEKHSLLHRSSIQRRLRRAEKEHILRQTRPMNTWLECPKCGAARETAQCRRCPHRGNGLDHREFRRTFTYEIDFGKLEQLVRARQPVAEMPARETARQEEPRRKTAEHQRTVVNTQITADATKAAQFVFEFCGLADISLIAKIAIGIIAEAKFQGIDLQAAAKQVAEIAIEQQKNGVSLNSFYWRDLKWRSNGGQQRVSAAQERFEHNRRAIAEGILSNYRDADDPDRGEREGDS
jgi:hypothetical protein